jgi:hypothetical protein
MWIVTRSDWPTLINLSRIANVGYQQIAKFDARTRVVASAWEQELVLADCANGAEARAVVDHIAAALSAGDALLDLRSIDPAALAGGASGAGS